MAEDREKNEKEGKEKAKSSFDIKIIVVGLVIFLVAMGASYFLMRSLMAPLYPETRHAGENKIGDGILISVGEFTTNVEDVGGNRYLKVEVFLEVQDKKVTKNIEESMPVIKDVILDILASKSVADLDVRNRDHLKDEIKQKINDKLGQDMVSNVYFTNFIMQ